MSVSEPTDVAGLPARAAALDLLSAALAKRGGIDEGLSHPALHALTPRDRAFARALVMATLRKLGPIDSALQAKIAKPPPDRVVQVLRLGVAQAFVLKTPAHAAVATSVDLAAADPQTRAFKGLVNAVLRGLTREPPDLDNPDHLAPPWLYARWRAAYGEAEARAVAAQIAQEPATDLTLKGAPPEGLEGALLPGGTFRTERGGDVSTWPGFAEGQWWVQDASAAVPARLLDIQPGETALDLCAAPGGKTQQLAHAGAQVTAVDRSAGRLKRLAENLARTGLSAAIVTADVTEWRDSRQFDAVLLDAPCSATGTFRRHPDVLWAVRPADIVALAALQTRLLDAAGKRVKPGGRLVYCVCSLEPEEGQPQVDAFLARNPDFTPAPIAAGEGGSPEPSVAAQGTLRVLPHHLAGGADGFFIARMRRKA